MTAYKPWLLDLHPWRFTQIEFRAAGLDRSDFFEATALTGARTYPNL